MKKRGLIILIALIIFAIIGVFVCITNCSTRDVNKRCLSYQLINNNREYEVSDCRQYIFYEPEQTKVVIPEYHRGKKRR